MTLGLRERQKIDRSNRILDVARTRFRTEGYEAVTIDSIAAEAGLSAVTVYNYYGTKANLLLALVKESDARLIAKLRDLNKRPPADIRDGVAEFARILRRHAMNYLTKPTWREVLAASILQGGGAFGRTYQDLDDVLIGLMRDLVRSYQQAGTLPRGIDAEALGCTLYEMQNLRFFKFISDDDQCEAAADRIFRLDLDMIMTGKCMTISDERDTQT